MNQNYFYIGHDQVNFFQGFISKLDIYIEILSVSSLTTNFCSDIVTTNCLINCEFLEYMENNLCSACLNSCNEGCVRGTDCNLCDDENCFQCSSFDVNSCLTCNGLFSLDLGKCSCGTGFVQVGSECVRCHASCLECKGTGFMDCISCSGVLDLVYDFTCVALCPTPCESASGVCACGSKIVADARFYEAGFSFGTVGSFSVGNDNLRFDFNDPFLQDSRGAYFCTYSFIHNSLILAYKFSLHFWIKVENPGNFLRKSLFSIIFSSDNTFTSSISLNGQILSSSAIFSLGAWSSIQVELTVNDLSIVQLNSYLAGVLVDSVVFVDDSRFIDDLGNFYIGQGVIGSQTFNGFQGFYGVLL